MAIDSFYFILKLHVQCRHLFPPVIIYIYQLLCIISFTVNVRGSFLMTKYSLIEMTKKNYGRILLIASIAGKEASVVLPCM